MLNAKSYIMDGRKICFISIAVFRASNHKSRFITHEYKFFPFFGLGYVWSISILSNLIKPQWHINLLILGYHTYTLNYILVKYVHGYFMNWVTCCL